ncbi:MAG: DUF1080 domain-containing protein [Planctomycetota bacterium]
MKVRPALTTVCTVLLLASARQAASSTGSPFYGDAPDDHHPWAVHDWNRPQPPRVEPGAPQEAKPPADALVLFDGTEACLEKWQPDDQKKGKMWVIKDGAFECVPGSGYARTKEEFGDCKLHVEWAAPTPPKGDSQGRGNSGIFMEGLVEIQVLDDYNNPTYSDGFACSVYGVSPPLANPLRPPGEFQQIDIEYRHPIYKEKECLDPGYVTVYCNGVLVQDKIQLEGSTGHMGRSKPRPFPEKGPLKLQDHGNPVRFRNIWLQPLPPRAGVDPGIHGPLTVEATMAKRKEIAAMVREDAAKLKDPANPVPEMLRLMESLVYEKEEKTAATVDHMTGQYVEGLKQLAADKVGAKKDEAKRINGAFKYLAKFNIVPADYAPKVELEKIIKDQGWDKK